jgi:hypothetical protein
MRPLRWRDLVDDLGYAVCVGEVDTEVVRRSAGGPHGIDRAEGCVRALQCGQFLFDQCRSGPLAARLHACKQIALEVVFVADKSREIRVVGIGLGYQIEQIECAARSRSQVGGDGRDDASRRSRDHEDAVLIECQAGLAIVRGLFLQTDRPAQSVLVADFDCAVVAQRLPDQDGRDLRSIAIRRKIDSFDEGVRALALVGLGESHYCAAHGSNSPGCVVPMLTAKACCRDQERARSGNLIVQLAHGEIERLHTDTQ